MDTSAWDKLTDKARKLKERGVRRVFAVDVHDQSVHEWGRTRWGCAPAGGRLRTELSGAG